MKTFHLYAMGPTNRFAPANPAHSIGVNDAGAAFDFLHNLVIVDTPERFSAEKLDAITKRTPRCMKLFSSVPEWNVVFRRFTLLKLARERGNCKTLNDPNMVPTSLCSPFVAACVAWSHLGARNVVMHGVDITSHPALSANQATIFRHFTVLRDAFRKNGGGLWVGSKESPMAEHVPVWIGRD
jgi:hypothetical protein